MSIEAQSFDRIINKINEIQEENEMMNDVEILKEMLITDLQILPREDSSVELMEMKSKGTLISKDLPKNSVIIKVDSFKESLSIFHGLKRERKRVDFVIVSNKDRKMNDLY